MAMSKWRRTTRICAVWPKTMPDAPNGETSPLDVAEGGAPAKRRAGRDNPMVATESPGMARSSVRVAVALLVLLLACPPDQSTGTPTTSPSTPVSKRTQQFIGVSFCRIRRSAQSAPSRRPTVWPNTPLAWTSSTTVQGRDAGRQRLREGQQDFEGFVTLRSPQRGHRASHHWDHHGQGDQDRGSSYSGRPKSSGHRGRYDNLAGRGRFSRGNEPVPQAPPSAFRSKLELIDPEWETCNRDLVPARSVVVL